MRRKKEPVVSIPHKYSFGWFIFICCFILIASIVLSISNKYLKIISWPSNYNDVIGVSTQILTAILSLVVSIIGIAISLQNEDYFGVKITKLYSLRKEKHFSIRQIIIISIVLCVINLIFYMLNLPIAAIGTMIVAFIFCVKVSYIEIPLMTKDENAILNIIKTNMIYCYIKKAEASKDLKSAIKYLLYNKNLAQLYDSLKDEKDEKYNTFLLMKLLEYQHDLAFELKDILDEGKQCEIGGSLLENVIDVALRHFKFSDASYEEIQKNKHLLTRVLFRIHELQPSKNKLLRKMGSIFQLLTFSSISSKYQDQFLSSLILILTAGTVKNGDFSIIGEIRKSISSSSWGIRNESPASTIFAVLSMYLFYLYESEPDTPKELKTKINDFINESGITEDIKIISWKKLFASASKTFEVNYHDFIKLSTRNRDSLEFWLYGNGAKSIVFDCRYFSNWYLTNLINSETISTFNFASLISNNPNITEQLKSFGDKCFDSDGIFTPDDEMQKIIKFYHEDEKAFGIFSIIEKRENNLFKLINNIKLRELRQDVHQASLLNEKSFCEEIKQSIEEKIENEWGYNSSLPIANSSRTFSIFIEKFTDAINFSDSIKDYCSESILNDISKSIRCSKIYNNENFEDNIRKILSLDLEFITSSTKQTIPHFFINDDDLKRLFFDTCEPLSEFNSNLLPIQTIVTKKGFSFNCTVDEVESRPLNENELSKKVLEYQRPDGQYVFRGAFLPQEEIRDTIKKKFMIISIVFKYQVISAEDTVFELFPYKSNPEI